MGLTLKQEEAFNLIKDGKTVFITGPGGCGKTYLIKYVKEQLSTVPNAVAVTALTGVAACLIGGQTLHSWAGIPGNDKTSKESILASIKRNSEAVDRWNMTQILIIDEVSMLPVELFNRLNFFGQQIRGNNKFFGGLQVVFSGDFCQLPPVGNIDKFCFESSTWIDNVKDIIYFKEVLRQKDPKLQKILNEIRLGVITTETKQLLNSRIISQTNKLPDTSEITSIKPTILYPYNKDVDDINEKALFSLISEHNVLPHSYMCKDAYKDWKIPERKLKTSEIKEINQLLENGSSCKGQITYCVGAQVMLIANLDFEKGLVNGSRGVIIDFVPIKKQKDTPTSTTPTPEEKNQKADALDMSHFDLAPVVKFNIEGTNNYIHKTILPYTWQLDHPKYTITRQQIPLIHAWAISIHKSQGQSCSLVVTDLKGVFTPGQAYVALSRIQTLEGLYLEGISYSKIGCHPKVKKFYAVLE